MNRDKNIIILESTYATGKTLLPHLLLNSVGVIQSGQQTIVFGEDPSISLFEQVADIGYGPVIIDSVTFDETGDKLIEELYEVITHPYSRNRLFIITTQMTLPPKFYELAFSWELRPIKFG